MTVVTIAVWLGFEPGNLLLFLTIPVILIAERGIPTTVVFFGLSIPPGGASVLRWILKMRSFEYLCLSFMFPELNETVDCWLSVKFYIHIVAVSLGFLQIFLYRFVQPYNIRELLEQGGEATPGWRKRENDSKP